MSGDLYIVINEINETGSTGGTSIQFNYGSSYNQTTGEMIKDGVLPGTGLQDFSTGVSLPNILKNYKGGSVVNNIYVQAGGPSFPTTNFNSLYTYYGPGGNILESITQTTTSALGDFRPPFAGGVSSASLSSGLSLPQGIRIVYDDLAI